MDWTKVVTQPLGLGGFALALVFAVVGRGAKSDKTPWLKPAAFAMASLALLGGLTLAFQQGEGAKPQMQSTAPPVTSGPVSVSASGCGVATYGSSGSGAIRTNCAPLPTATPSAPTGPAAAALTR